MQASNSCRVQNKIVVGCPTLSITCCNVGLFDPWAVSVRARDIRCQLFAGRTMQITEWYNLEVALGGACAAL